MPRLLLDFTGVDLEDKEFEPIPAGVYQARVDASQAEVKRSQNGNDYLTLCFVIENHPEFTGRKVFENYALTPKAMWKLGKVLKALGVLPTDALKFTFDTTEIHNKPCKIKVRQEAYQDTVRNRVDAVMPLEPEQVKKRITF
jgi:hypothetical protein